MTICKYVQTSKCPMCNRTLVNARAKGSPEKMLNTRVAIQESVSSSVPPRRCRIGELVGYTGLSRQTLHNYTQWGLIREVGWTPGGHRVYGEEAFTRLERIIKLKRTRSMAEIRHLFNVAPSP